MLAANRWNRRCLLGSIIVLAVVAAGLATTAKSFALANDSPSAHTVRLIIDYGDGVQKHFTTIAWKKDMTVLDAMNEAKASPHGIAFQHTGSGATAFLTKIDDQQNEGGGKRNWLYWVNTALADKSFGAYKLDPSDVVLWKFTNQQIKP